MKYNLMKETYQNSLYEAERALSILHLLQYSLEHEKVKQADIMSTINVLEEKLCKLKKNLGELEGLFD